MRYFVQYNGPKSKNDVLGLTRFDDENMATAHWNAKSQMWMPDTEFDIDTVSGMNTDAREVDEAEAERIKGALVAL